jgi:hypothetical protein
MVLSGFSRDEETHFRFTASDRSSPAHDLSALQSDTFIDGPMPLLGDNGMLSGAIAGVVLPGSVARRVPRAVLVHRDMGKLSISRVFEQFGHRGKFAFHGG